MISKIFPSISFLSSVHTFSNIQNKNHIGIGQWNKITLVKSCNMQIKKKRVEEEKESKSFTKYLELCNLCFLGKG